VERADLYISLKFIKYGNLSEAVTPVVLIAVTCLFVSVFPILKVVIDLEFEMVEFAPFLQVE